MSVFSEGEDVLMRGSDGLLYLGVLVEVEQNEALVRFGDGTEKTAKFGDLRRLGSGLADNSAAAEVPRSRPPTPPPPVLTPYDGMDVPYHVLKARRELPYDFESLIWDANHERNIEEKYCYCGESGVWYKKMLQCGRCQQWFHQECIRNPNVPQLLLGDRFWEFVCTLCTGTTEETVRRLYIGWVDALHLILFNLIVSNRKEHHDLETAIIPLFKKKLAILQSPSSVLKSSRIELNHLESLLRANKSRFKCGSSSSKRTRYWTLIKVGPPLAPHNKAYQKDSSVIDVNFKCKQNQLFTSKQTSQPRRPALKTASIFKKAKQRKQNKESLDSIGESSDASSFGSLDSFIPPPKDFEGENHPFRSGFMPCSEFAPASLFIRPSKRERKRRWSPPSLGSAGSSPHSSISSLSSTEPIPASSIASPSSLNSKLVEDNIKEDLKWSLNSYFGANHRIARGEKFEVTAKRLTSFGDVQHLMAWEQPITKPFLISEQQTSI